MLRYAAVVVAGLAVVVSVMVAGMVAAGAYLAAAYYSLTIPLLAYAARLIWSSR